MTILERILARTRADLERRRAALPETALERRARERSERRPFAAALDGERIALIAEYKRRSPSAGDIRPDAPIAEVVSAYERGGAAAVSVLTDEPHFGGRLADLAEARAACRLPLLRKDFVVDRYQLLEAAAGGADAILLIVAALDQPALERLHAEAGELGLEALVEVHDREELGRAAAAGARLIGVNNRDLRDFSVDVGRTAALAPDLPRGATLVSESGIHPGDDLAPLAAAGVRAVLVGEALMRASDIEAACRALSAFELAGEPS